MTINIQSNITLAPKPDTFHLGFLNDIEGLRAVAISLVIASRRSTNG